MKDDFKDLRDRFDSHPRKAIKSISKDFKFGDLDSLLKGSQNVNTGQRRTQMRRSRAVGQLDNGLPNRAGDFFQRINVHIYHPASCAVTNCHAAILMLLAASSSCVF